MSTFDFQPATVFFIIRTLGIVGFTCYCEWKLFCSLRRYSASIANWFLLLNTIAPGMSHAGVALLPSSLAMQTTMLANSFILEAIKSKEPPGKTNQHIKGNILVLYWWNIRMAICVGFGITSWILHHLSISCYRQSSIDSFVSSFICFIDCCCTYNDN